ncbi:MAG: hypothetical protein ABI267_08900, partial [Ginsengibacter sp.]
IADSTSEIITNSQNKIEIRSLGDNQKQILFLVNNSSTEFLPDDEMALLTNLISACKLSMADIALVNFNFHKKNYREFDAQFKPKKIMIFGIKTSELDLPFAVPNFQIQPFHQQFYLTAPSLNNFLNNKNLKKELWICLQKLFL